MIGHFEATLAEIIGSKTHSKQGYLVLPLKPNRLNGTIKIVAQGVAGNKQESSAETSAFDDVAHSVINKLVMMQRKMQECEQALQSVPASINRQVQHVTMRCSASKLDKKDLFGKSDPYFIIYKSDAMHKQVYKSEIVMVNLNPIWQPVRLRVDDLCTNNDLNTPLEVQVYDWDRLKSHDLIGIFTCSVKLLLQGSGKTNFAVVHPCIVLFVQ